MKPDTKYTKSGTVNIAYQVFGSGSIDLVYIPGWVSNIDCMWACPELVAFLEALGKIARVILFDKRGTGLSDRVVSFPTLEERMDDIRAVMDAVDSKKAVLFGHSEGGSVSALFAATYPSRTISLIAFGIFAKRRYASYYPWAPTDQERQKVYDMIENDWGSGEMQLETLAPSKANDKVFMDWLASYFRSGASPSAALKLTKMNTQVDIIDILGSIKVPTLLLQRTNDIDVKIEEGRFIAERIENAKLIELEGSDHLFWTGNTEAVLKEMTPFILNEVPEAEHKKKLFTVIVARFIKPNTNNFRCYKLISDHIEKYKGHLADYNDHAFTITFEGPSKAVDCSIQLTEALKKCNAALAIGIHIKECSLATSMSKQTEDFAALIAKQSVPNEIIVTQTVKNLLTEASVSFTPHKIIYETTFGDSFLLYTITQKCNKQLQEIVKNKNTQKNTFLENVIHVINKHIDNEYFGVEMLCKEIGVSERQLQRKIKAIVKKSPNQLISSMRLNLAKELIRNTQFTISEIAFKTGFSDPSYFSKCFKKEFSMCPSDLKS